MKYFILFLLLFNVLQTFSQPSDTTYVLGDSTEFEVIDSVGAEFGEMLDSVFAKLDTSYLATGRLGDKSFCLAPVVNYQGVLHDSNYADFNTMLNLFSYIKWSYFDDSNPLDSIQDFKSKLSSHKDSSYISLSVIDYNYDKLKPYAFDSNLIDTQGIQFIDVAGRQECHPMNSKS